MTKKGIVLIVKQGVFRWTFRPIGRLVELPLSLFKRFNGNKIPSEFDVIRLIHYHKLYYLKIAVFVKNSFVKILCLLCIFHREVVGEDESNKYVPVHLREDIMNSSDDIVMTYLDSWPWKNNIVVRKSVGARVSKVFFSGILIMG